jgi:hypothetical protein
MNKRKDTSRPYSSFRSQNSFCVGESAGNTMTRDEQPRYARATREMRTNNDAAESRNTIQRKTSEKSLVGMWTVAPLPRG